MPLNTILQEMCKNTNRNMFEKDTHNYLWLETCHY